MRSFAAITLEKWLQKNQSQELVRPYIKKLLVIYMKIIEECDHDVLIDALRGIFETFKDEIQPFVGELLQKMVQILLSLNIKNQSDETQKTDLELCQLTAFETIRTLLCE